MISNIGCTLPSILKQMICYTQSLNRQEITLSQIGFFSEIRDKHDVDEAIFLVDGAVPLHRACEKHNLDFRYERHGNRNSVERVFREVKRRTTCFSNCFSNAQAETADEWLRSFAFAWNQLI
jgi:transposase-like protein